MIHPLHLRLLVREVLCFRYAFFRFRVHQQICDASLLFSFLSLSVVVVIDGTFNVFCLALLQQTEMMEAAMISKCRWHPKKQVRITSRPSRASNRIALPKLAHLPELAHHPLAPFPDLHYITSSCAVANRSGVVCRLRESEPEDQDASAQVVQAQRGLSIAYGFAFCAIAFESSLALRAIAINVVPIPALDQAVTACLAFAILLLARGNFV